MVAPMQPQQQMMMQPPNVYMSAPGTQEPLLPGNDQAEKMEVAPPSELLVVETKEAEGEFLTKKAAALKDLQPIVQE